MKNTAKLLSLLLAVLIAASIFSACKRVSVATSNETIGTTAANNELTSPVTNAPATEPTTTDSLTTDGDTTDYNTADIQTTDAPTTQPPTTESSTTDSASEEYTVTWKTDDGAVIDSTIVIRGGVPAHAAPEKESTAQYDYTFAGWSPNITAVTRDATYTAVFTPVLRSYTITWQLDADTVIDTATLSYGSMPTHADVTKASDLKFDYTFVGWSPSIVAVDGEATYTAVFSSSFVPSWYTPGLEFVLTNSSTYSVRAGTARSGEIVIPSYYNGKPVTSVAQNGFESCRDITSIVIGNMVTSLDENAFSDCTGLISVTIPSSVVIIGRFAFSSCASLTEITIPSSVVIIGDGAFYGCRMLTELTIPDSVTSIGTQAFANCVKLLNIFLDGDNISYTSIDGVLFTRDRTIIVCYPVGRTAETYEIPSFVTDIGQYAFAYCAMTNITIPNSVASIGQSAFAYCNSLTSIKIPDSITSIGQYAFYYSGVWNSAPNNSVIYIGKWVVGSKGTLGAVTLKDGTVGIGDRALSNSSMTSIVISNSMKIIEAWAFYSCINLKSVVFGNSVTTIGQYAFYACTSLETVTLPSSVTTIGQYAFYDCTSLTTVTLPSSLTIINSGAFFYCPKLTTVRYRGTQEQWNAITKGTGIFSSTGVTGPTQYNYAGA